MSARRALHLIISREYLERVKRKSFIISTILMPLLMMGLMVAPALIAIMAEPEESIVAVIDDTGVIAPMLQNEGEVRFAPFGGALDDAKSNEAYDAILVIGRSAVSQPRGSITLYTRGAPSMQTEQYISSQLEDAITSQRIKEYDIANLRQIMEEVQVDVEMDTFRIDREEESATSSMLSYILGMVVMFILYMFILLYGQMVMTSIIEEKNNRVLELVVSSVRPTDLMLGKILGIGLVAITQILVWAVLLIACSVWLMPVLAGAVSSGDNVSLSQAVTTLGDTSYMLGIFGYMVLFLIGGYLFYSSIYAAIGSAVDNIQDASQLQSVAMVPIILALLVSMSVVTEPNSSLALWTSMIPFTSPMVLMARLPFGIPAWQPVVSMLILVASLLGMIWLSAKIYRVGIFMYGKKPTVAELIRWTRYK